MWSYNSCSMKKLFEERIAKINVLKININK